MENHQKTYFDNRRHRYRTDYLLSPPKAQLLEYQQMEKLLRLPTASSLMDFGSGNGRITLYFLRRGYHVHAVDISKTSLLELTTMYTRKKTPSWGVLTTSTKIPTTRLFDGVVGADVLHHVDVGTVLPQIKKVVKKNGVLVFSEPNGWNILWYIYIFLRRLPWSIEKNICHMNPFFLRDAFDAANIHWLSITHFRFRLLIRAENA